MLFDIERGIDGGSAEERLQTRREESAPLLAGLEAWLRDERARLSRSASVAKPIDYMFKRWERFTRLIDDGRICLTDNADGRALRGFPHKLQLWLHTSGLATTFWRPARANSPIISTCLYVDYHSLALLATVLGPLSCFGALLTTSSGRFGRRSWLAILS